jgi:hypothetical protein
MRACSVFLVEAMTTAGRVSEAFATYEEAAARVASIPDAELVGMPLIFQDLPDGSQRIVREDGKPTPCRWPRRTYRWASCGRSTRRRTRHRTRSIRWGGCGEGRKKKSSPQRHRDTEKKTEKAIDSEGMPSVFSLCNR